LYNAKLWGKTLQSFDLSQLSTTYKDACLPKGWKSFSSVIFHEKNCRHLRRLQHLILMVALSRQIFAELEHMHGLSFFLQSRRNFRNIMMMVTSWLVT
jgi:hypothetical protein